MTHLKDSKSALTVVTDGINLKERDPAAWERSLVEKIRHLEKELAPLEDDDPWPAYPNLAARAPVEDLTPERRARLSAELDAARLEYEPIARAHARKSSRKRLTKAGWETRVLDTIGAPGFKSSGPYHEALRGLNHRDGGLVVLSGNVGSTKTTSAAAWASEWPHDAPRFMRAAEFFRSSRYDDKRDEILTYHALVLDDLGAEYADKNGSYATDFDELCDSYYGRKATLVITSNILWASPAQRAEAKAKGVKVDEAQPTFVERYGERVVDRIRHCGKWVSSSVPSMRRKE